MRSTRQRFTLTGYRESRPVRIGNAAHSQLQLDVYGALVSVAFFEVNAGMMVEYDRWNKVRTVLDSLSKIWDKPEQGIWEIRGEPRSFLHSRLMCWVAFDRVIKIARMRSLPAPVQEWTEIRDRIYDSIHSDFWNEQLKSFVQYQHGTELDASTLLMAQLEFISPADPRWLNSLKAITAKLIQDRAVMRYDTSTGVDGLPGGEGSFTPCSFWYIQALTVTGEMERARLMFDKMLGYSNHLGLYAEELGLSGEHLGNFPQALTHLSLIQCALTLNDALERKDSIKPLQSGLFGQTM